MKPLSLLAVLLVVMFAGCSKTAPCAQYRDAQLKRGMKIADIKQQFGEPDSFDEWWSKNPDDNRYDGKSHESPEYSHHHQVLHFGAFGAHDQQNGHITKHRLSMTFIDGELYNWMKSTPIDRE